MILKLFLVVLVVVALAIVGLATQIIFKKNGQFPDTHVGHNKNMRKLGIRCVKTFDSVEQKKANKGLQFEHLRLADENKA